MCMKATKAEKRESKRESKRKTMEEEERETDQNWLTQSIQSPMTERVGQLARFEILWPSPTLESCRSRLSYATFLLSSVV